MVGLESVHFDEVPRLLMAVGSGEHNSEIAEVGFPGGTVVKNLPCNEGDNSLIPGLGRSHMPQSN